MCGAVPMAVSIGGKIKGALLGGLIMGTFYSRLIKSPKEYAPSVDDKLFCVYLPVMTKSMAVS